MSKLDVLHLQLIEELLKLLKDPAYIEYHRTRTTMRPQGVEDEYEKTVIPRIEELQDKLRLIVEIDLIEKERET